MQPTAATSRRLWWSAPSRTPFSPALQFAPMAWRSQSGAWTERLSPGPDDRQADTKVSRGIPATSSGSPTAPTAVASPQPRPRAGRRSRMPVPGGESEVLGRKVGEPVSTPRRGLGRLPVDGVQPDGRPVLSTAVGTTTEPGLAQVCDATTGHEIFTLRGHTAPVFWVAVNPDGVPDRHGAVPTGLSRSGMQRPAKWS